MTLQAIIYYYISPTVAALTVIFNLIEIIFLVKQYKRNMSARIQRHAIPIILFGNLAFSDLLVGVTVIAIKVMDVLFRDKVIPVTRTNVNVYYIFKFNILRLSLLTSFFNLILLTVDRFLAVRFPLAYRTRADNKRAFVLVLITWVLSVAFTSIHYYMSFHAGINLVKYDLVIFPAVVIPATFAFPVCNFMIVKAVRKHGEGLRQMTNNTACVSNSRSTNNTKMTNSRRNSSQSINRATLHIIKREAKIYRLALTVVIAFIVCWLPMAICGLLLIAKIPVDGHVVNIVFTLAFTNSLIDPLAYFGFKDNIRRKIKMLFHTCSSSCFLPEQGGTRSDVHLFSITSSQDSHLSQQMGQSTCLSTETMF
ncbi:neuropeptide FF receptor 2-like [Rhopilema esculentum]|uniref:neuropeptide FF receptor 2-like n=1 Tax=Rhopilema esculentum TaxID=499914 RepID=UPI0031DDB259